jgi:hypothetical protein
MPSTTLFSRADNQATAWLAAMLAVGDAHAQTVALSERFDSVVEAAVRQHRHGTVAVW